jgi:hypothetical protein
MKRLIAACAILALTACTVTPTVYAPAANPQATGYREMRIENERYRVTFRANSDLKPAQVEDMAMRRAAELTLTNGYQWFNVVTRNTEQVGGDRGGGGPSIGIGGSSGSYGSSVGVGVGFNLSGDTRQFEATLEILLGKGAKPADPDAYDAQQVLARPG